MKRLMRLARAPKVIQDACHQGVLVDQVNERGAVKLLPSGNAKQERNRLDLMAALEFAKFHAHAVKSSPKKADERTARAIQRALSERWSFRRVQAFCRTAVTGQDGEVDAGLQSSEATPLPLFIDGPELRIRRAQLKSATLEERAALRTLLTALIEELPS